jgi:hypothetical protein
MSGSAATKVVAAIAAKARQFPRKTTNQITQSPTSTEKNTRA